MLTVFTALEEDGQKSAHGTHQTFHQVTQAVIVHEAFRSAKYARFYGRLLGFLHYRGSGWSKLPTVVEALEGIFPGGEAPFVPVLRTHFQTNVSTGSLPRDDDIRMGAENLIQLVAEILGGPYENLDALPLQLVNRAR